MPNPNNRSLMLAALAVVLVSVASGGEVSLTAGQNIYYYVDAHATGTGDGSNWTNAFVYLQDALAVAGPGSEIRVAQGVYRPHQGTGLKGADPASTFQLRSGIVLKGGYAGGKGSSLQERDVAAHETTLSGDLLGNDEPNIGPKGLAGHPSRSDNSYHVVTMVGTDSTAVLDGFTITGGHALTGREPDETVYGAGLYLEAASPMIRNCLIAGNAAGCYGGGVYIRDRSAPTLIECAITDNWSSVRGGGLYKDGGCDLCLERCLVSGNVAGLDGGGVAGHANGSLTLSNCILAGNAANASATGRGGGLYCFLATVHLNHCTFEGNWAAFGGSIACRTTGEPGTCNVAVRNCILWDLGTTIWSEGQSFVQIDCSDVRGGWPGPGNIDVDPNFVSTGRWDLGGAADDPRDDTWVDGDYRLAWHSLCVDTGDPCEAVDANDMDFAGLPRFSGLQVDMGAYELKNEPPVADADPDVTGFSLAGEPGLVTFDASRSADPEGRPLTYVWYREGQLVSSQARFTMDLPVGVHTLNLIVNDGTFDSPPEEVRASVTRAVHTTAYVSPVQLMRKASQPVIAVLVLPKGKRLTDFDARRPVLLLPGRIKPVAQSAFGWFHGQVLVMARFNRADLMAAVPNNGRIELNLVGQLSDSTYFSGADAVNIK